MQVKLAISYIESYLSISSNRGDILLPQLLKQGPFFSNIFLLWMTTILDLAMSFIKCEMLLAIQSTQSALFGQCGMKLILFIDTLHWNEIPLPGPQIMDNRCYLTRKGWHPLQVVWEALVPSSSSSYPTLPWFLHMNDHYHWSILGKIWNDPCKITQCAVFGQYEACLSYLLTHCTQVNL